MDRYGRFLSELDRAYLAVHVPKEEAFWVERMGLSPDAVGAREERARTEIEANRFLQDPALLSAVRRELACAELAAQDARAEQPSLEQLACLRGWARTLEVHGIESPAARLLAEEIVEVEGLLAESRREMRLGHHARGQSFQPASSVRLAWMLRCDPEEDQRRAAWRGLRSIEEHVLDGGFCDLVRMRNRLGRMLGAEDYYDWRVRRNEGMTKEELFGLLDELEGQTRSTAEGFLQRLEATAGAQARQPWNVLFASGAQVREEEEAYFPLAAAVERWIRSFQGLGISYRGASIVLDLFDRPGKYENGFMHLPEPARREASGLKPARIHLAANGIVGVRGAGARALRTLLHEGGHAAHFANVDQPAFCFAQELAPTSPSHAETQSLFLESLVSDPQWLRRYALDGHGQPPSTEWVERRIASEQPARALGLRSSLAVCYGEKAIYEIPEAELSPERVLAELRSVEERFALTPGGAPRPILSVPHLLAGDSSAYYHSYLLARMAVDQTREHFLGRDGHIVDNPRVGRELASACWKPGNAIDFRASVRSLTGRELQAHALADSVNRPVEEELQRARERMAEVASMAPSSHEELEACLRINHGRETLCELEGRDLASFCTDFARWALQLEEAASGASA